MSSSSRKRGITGLLCLLLSLAGHAQTTPAGARTPAETTQLPRYEGSEPSSSTVQEFARYALVTAVSPRGELAGETVVGRLTRMIYLNPDSRSTLEIYENYRKSLLDQDFVPMFDCALEACGPAYARSAWNRHNGLFAAADGDPRYLAGRRVTAEGTTYVALMVGRRRTQLDIVEVVPMQVDKVLVDATALGKGIDGEGRVSVYGILFDTDQAKVQPESAPALAEIATLLKQRPELKLYVVGHTDMSGSFEHNLELSAARAKAVVQVLIETHGIAADRLQGHGVGPLAPVASNLSEAGRGQNRRVELVAR